MRKKLRFLIAALGAVALVAVVGVMWYQGANAKAEGPIPVPKDLIACSQCHTMTHEVSTWEQSPHGNVSCLECHLESDVAWVRHELGDKGTDMASNLSNTKVHSLPLKAPNERCLECHGDQMPYILQDVVPPPANSGGTAAAAAGQTKAMDIKALHSKHMNGDSKLDCLACHVDAVHGPAEGTQERQDEAHNLCLTCHAEKRVTMTSTGSVSCTACHVDAASVAPADHKDTNAWMAAHGTSSQTSNCGQCHLANSAGPHTDMTNPAVFKTNSTEDACTTCHAGQPMPHPANFIAQHGTAAEKAAPGACDRCHTPEQNPIKPTPDYAKAGFCTDCHAGTTMPHPAGYLAQHGTAAKNSPATCQACHSSKNPIRPLPDYAGSGYCTNCHAGTTMPHPANYLAQHGSAAMKSPASCEACHSSKNSVNRTSAHSSQAFCSSCHDQYQHAAGWVAQHGDKVDATCATCHTMRGQPGTKNACDSCHSTQYSKEQWHPDLWYVSHARAVEQQGKEACMTCHNGEIQPSCSKCHRNY
jgi:hypothetical protein